MRCSVTGLATFQFLADRPPYRRLDVGLLQRGFQGLVDERLIAAIPRQRSPADPGCLVEHRFPGRVGRDRVND
jgi:hypothetical protein